MAFFVFFNLPNAIIVGKQLNFGQPASAIELACAQRLPNRQNIHLCAHHCFFLVIFTWESKKMKTNIVGNDFLSETDEMMAI